MTRARFFVPDVRLKRLLAEPGGMRAKDALNRADEAIESVRDSCLQAIDRKISEIGAYTEGAIEQTRHCYRLSNEVYAEAGILGLAELSDVAHNLCEILSLSAEGSVSSRAVKVHVDAMHALRTPAVSANRQLRQAVVQELHRLTSRLAHHS